MHPNKHIRKALQEAVAAGWTFKKGNPRAHIYGTLRCPLSSRDGCLIRVFSTPRSPEHHARWIRAQVAKCPH